MIKSTTYTMNEIDIYTAIKDYLHKKQGIDPSAVCQVSGSAKELKVIISDVEIKP